MKAGLTTTEVAEAMEWAQATVSRFETGNTGVRARDVERLCKLYGADQETTAALMALAPQTRRPEWWRAYGDAIPRSLDLLLGLEQAASNFRVWEPHLVPGILQTEAYAETIMRADHSLSDDEVELRVKARMNRQSLLLNRDDLPALDILIGHDVVELPAIPSEVMAEQLDQLLKVSSDHPRVALRVVPREVGLPGLVAYSFCILDFPDTYGEPTTVQTDGWITPLYYTKRRETTRFIDTFQSLASLSLDVATSRDLIKQTRSRHETQQSVDQK
jgi:transcriptional regulator with XRE-family HTH domain